MICLLISSLPAFAKNTILIVGDSISAGYGIPVESSWTKLLQQRLNESGYQYGVINASISGNTTSNGITVLRKVLTQFHPSITIIELGGNDGLRGIQVDVIKKNLIELIQMAKAAKSTVLLLGIRLPPNYGEVYNQRFLAVYTDVAKSENVAFVPFLLQGIDDQANLMQTDGVHPKAQAQIILLETVWKKLKPLLKA